MNIRLMWGLLLTLGKLRRRERWLRPQLEAYQAESLRQLREYAYARSPFYQRFHKGLTDRPLQELPVLTKSTMMEHFDDMVTDRSIRQADVRAYVANDQTGRPFLNRYMDIASISGWQITQEADGLTVLVSGAQDGFMDQILMDKLAQALMEQGVRIPHISVQRVDTIPKTAAGKAPLIKKI
jgi:hypothetical protein